MSACSSHNSSLESHIKRKKQDEIFIQIGLFENRIKTSVASDRIELMVGSIAAAATTGNANEFRNNGP